MTTFHAFLLAQHQFCNISGSYLEGHNKRHHASVTPAVCPASKEQPLPNASLSTQGSCPSFSCSRKNTSIFAPEWSITEWLHKGHSSPKHPSISVLITSAKKSLPLNCKMGLGIWQWFRIWGEERDHCFGSGLGVAVESVCASWLLSHYIFSSNQWNHGHLPKTQTALG